MRALLPMLLLLAGCHGFPTHPVVPRADAVAPVLPSPPAAEAPEIPLPDGPDAFAMLFAGLSDMESPLDRLAASTSAPGLTPPLQMLAGVERAVIQRYAGRTPLGALRNVVAFGFSGHAPLPPRAMADLLSSDRVGKHTLGADRFEAGPWLYRSPGQWRRTYRTEMLNRGQGPFRFDIRFTSTMERWDLPDGTVLLRYDPWLDPPPEHITLYRGACRIVPDGTGCRMTEFLIVGTDIQVPFFVLGTLRKSSIDTFRSRVDRLWALAHRQAGQAPPR